MDLGQFPGLRHHGVELGGHDLGAHRPLHQLADGADVRLELLFGANADLGAQAGVGGDAVHQAQFVRLSNLIQISGVDEKFHNDLLSYHKSTAGTTLEAFQTAFGAEKIDLAIFFDLQGFFPGDESPAHGVLYQDIRLPRLPGGGRLGPQAQGFGHLFDHPIYQISNNQACK